MKCDYFHNTGNQKLRLVYKDGGKGSTTLMVDPVDALVLHVSKYYKNPGSLATYYVVPAQYENWMRHLYLSKSQLKWKT